jgi:hypothetical protein
MAGLTKKMTSPILLRRGFGGQAGDGAKRKEYPRRCRERIKKKPLTVQGANKKFFPRVQQVAHPTCQPFIVIIITTGIIWVNKVFFLNSSCKNGV